MFVYLTVKNYEKREDEIIALWYMLIMSSWAKIIHDVFGQTHPCHI